MRNQHPQISHPNQPAFRSGVTITEVLMSLAIMGIGIVVVASLFPAAVLRTIHATQLTNGTILRYNAESAVDVRKMARFRPGSTTEAQVYLVDPLGYRTREADGDATPGTLSGATNLTRLTDGIGAAAADTAAAVNAAAAVVTLPDSWVEQARGDVNASTVTRDSDAGTASITLPNPPMDISHLDSGMLVRVILFNATGRGSVTLDADPPDPSQSQTLTFTTNSAKHLNAIMDARAFTPGGLAIVQAQERRYTWMLTVRQDVPFTGGTSGPAPKYDIVVFFNRSFNPVDEKTYLATATLAQKAASRVQVAFDPAPAKPPHYQRGGFIFLFAGNTGKWYRVQKVFSEETDNVVLQLDEAPPASSSAVLMRGIVEVFEDLDS
jgi:Tfp pilus assembly protein PilV